MKAIEALTSVLCDPEGKCCISGSDDDRRLIDSALAELAANAADRAIEGCPELNMGNYDEVGVERLNDWAIRANDEIDRLHALAAGQAIAARQPHRSGCTAGSDEECVQRGCGTNCPAVSPRADSPPAPVLDERDDFEKVFPLPSGCVRVGAGYAATGYSNWAAHTHCERWQGWQARAARDPADSVQEDAACWHWMAEYLVGTRTDLDDEIVACETVNDLRKLVEAARKQGASHDNS